MSGRFIAEQVFAYLGLVLWSFQLAPQAIKSYRRKTTEGVSPWMMLIWALSGAFLGNYNIGLGVAIPLWVQPQLFAFIAYVCLVQEVHYCKGWSTLKTWLALIALCICTGAFEVALLFAFWAAQRNNVQGAITFFGVMPVVTIIIGFLPQYIKIFRESKVEGVSRVFLCMDFFGSIFSSISLGFRDEVDALDIVNYTAIAVLDLGIFLLYYFYAWFIGRDKQKQPENGKDDNDSDAITSNDDNSM
ncbi:hypothetical protein VTP01DRAFT_9286 [Rhizomucor pusillus]|uniref:uncharacterized protein n=1 Tax=Rhizomucor pusillus TaxID=4840 RepID=UPI0037443D72